MYHEVFIIVRQSFFVSRGFHYQTADNNPVMATLSSFTDAEDFIKRIVTPTLLPTDSVERIDTMQSMGLIRSYVVKNERGIVDRAYNIIQDIVLP